MGDHAPDADPLQEGSAFVRSGLRCPRPRRTAPRIVPLQLRATGVLSLHRMDQRTTQMTQIKTRTLRSALAAGAATDAECGVTPQQRAEINAKLVRG